MYRKASLSANNMIQERSIPKTKPEPKTQLKSEIQKAQKLRYNQNVGTSNQVQEHFSFKLQEAVSVDNPTIGWSYNVPVLSPNQKYIYLATEGFTTILTDFIGDNFPQTISIGLMNFSGFTSKNGTPSNKIMVLNLYQVSSSINPQGIQYRDLIYKSQGNTMWELGSLRNLNFLLYLDEQTEPVNFPIINPVNLVFKIIHLSI